MATDKAKIKDILKDNNWNVSDLARILDVDRQAVSNWINKGTRISNRHKDRLNKLWLGESITEIASIPTDILIQEIKKRGAKQIIF